MHPRLLMDFSLRCVRIFPGVNSRAELVTLAPGLRPERRFAPLARGQFSYRDECSLLYITDILSLPVKKTFKVLGVM